jgi:S-adenosylmethionine hydrolase
MRPIITLTTDFGTKDPFVGQMKGVILGINPDAEIIDITHDISPQNITEGAIVAGLSYEYFPPHTIHIVVVDPGVGSGRRALIVRTEKHLFVGPDNGIFSMIYIREKGSFDVTHITSERFFMKKQSATFHGRDIFAPVAAWLSTGVPVEKFGKTIDDYITLPLKEPSIKPGAIRGEIILIDGFGNASSNITSDLLKSTFHNLEKIEVSIKEMRIPLMKSYLEAEGKGLCCILNSSGLLEFFVYRGRAAERFNINIGDPVEVRASIVSAGASI